MRTAIMGTGSLGTILGAYITKAGKQVDLIDVNEEHVKALNEKGAHVIGTVDFTVPVKACTPDQMEGEYDLILFMVKQTYNDSATKALEGHIHDKTIICTLQNGLPEDALIDIYGPERVMGCTVSWGATWQGPGVSELTSEPNSMSFDLGRPDGKITPEMEQVKDILECMCPTHLLENLMGIRWSKLFINATFSGMSACLGCTFGEVVETDKGTECVKYIGNELFTICDAAGIKMEKISGVDVVTLLRLDTPEKLKSTTAAYRFMIQAHKLLKASMLQDLEKGRKTEIDAINGAVVAAGKRVGVPTPMNDKVVEIVHAEEDGKLKPQMSNLDLFTIPTITF
ncbi:ketopantoate reductase family protein [Ruminococcaceae bacterium OttesenSCG-928-O06]|nr:ketopantoate reductase family protein [Ruminococcaceae bacterium OttesenSCG-928-O06]